MAMNAGALPIVDKEGVLDELRSSLHICDVVLQHSAHNGEPAEARSIGLSRAARLREAIRFIEEHAQESKGDVGVTDKIVRYLALADQVFQVAESDAIAETKYDLIFSEDLSRALEQIFHLDYYDPDMSYEDDVEAYVSALRDKCVELRKIGADR